MIFPLPPPPLPPVFVHADEAFICPSICPSLCLVSSRFEHFLPLHTTSSQLFYLHLSTATSSLSSPPQKLSFCTFFHPFFLHPQLQTSNYTHIHHNTHTHMTKVSKTPRCVPPSFPFQKEPPPSLIHLYFCAHVFTLCGHLENTSHTHTYQSKRAEKKKK